VLPTNKLGCFMGIPFQNLSVLILKSYVSVNRHCWTTALFQLNKLDYLWSESFISIDQLDCFYFLNWAVLMVQLV
jgi:hypothetical protein